MDSTSTHNIFSNDDIPVVACSSPRAMFFATYFPHQEWSFPDSVIYYITKNPSTPKCYEKMIQSCKHFFIKNPILVVGELSLSYNNNKLKTYFNGTLVDLKKLGSKIWTIYKFRCDNGNINFCGESNFLLPVISKIYQSKIKELFLYKQNIFFNDLKFLASTCERIQFNYGMVTTENGSVIQLEDIFRFSPKCKNFLYTLGDDVDRASKVVTSKTVKELLKVPHFSNLTHIALDGVPENFDIDAFYDYIKKHKNTSTTLYFRNQLSVGYKARLQEIVDEIVENESEDYMLPIILFPGIIESSRDKMLKLLSRN